MNSEVDYDVKFANTHIPAITRGTKWLTARYGFESTVSKGDIASLCDEEGNQIALVEITRVEVMSVQAFYESDFDGHRSYSDLDSFIEILHEYYPDADIDLSTHLTVIWWNPETITET